MNARARCFQLLPKLRLWFGIAWLGAGVSAFAQTAYKFDAATVSGLPARNIGSAMMSGRIAALDAVDQDGRITVFVAAASGGGWEVVKGGHPVLPVVVREGVPTSGTGAVDTSDPEMAWGGSGRSSTSTSVL